MRNSTPVTSQHSWMLPLWSALIVVVGYLSIAFWSVDAYILASVLFIAPALIIISIVLIVYAIIRKGRKSRIALLSTVSILWLSSIFMFFVDAKYGLAIRTDARWAIWSRHYKADVLAQAASSNGDLKHVEWDGWGFAPAGDTTVYLVYDLSDSLSNAGRSGQPGKLDGIPCAVANVKRLERNWYTIQFYTNEVWDHCGNDSRADSDTMQYHRSRAGSAQT